MEFIVNLWFSIQFSQLALANKSNHLHSLGTIKNPLKKRVTIRTLGSIHQIDRSS